MTEQTAARSPVSGTDWSIIGLAAWSVGFTLTMAHTAAGLLICVRRRRRAAPMREAEDMSHSTSCELRMRARVEVRSSNEIAVPETFGFRNPVILLPPGANGWTRERLRLVLLHELVHVKGSDWALQMLARITASLFWFNPLTWYALTKLRDERERACDDEVLRLGAIRSEYADQLLAIARSARYTSPVAVAMARKAHLEGRIHAILNPNINRRRLTLTRKAITLAATALIVATASLVTAPAQTGNAEIMGIVKDPSGARVPGIQVVLSRGSAQETVRTNAEGAFNFSGIPDGTYSLKVMAPGFKLLEIPDVAANGSTPAFVDLSLEVGAISERITITAQGQPRQQPTIPSTALQQQGSKPRTISFASVSVNRPVPAARPQRIPIGGNIRPSKLIKSPRPEYPAHLAAQGVEGTVLLEAVIGTSGQMVNIRARNSQVHPELIQAAIDAIRQWQYEPTLLNGKAVEIVTTLTVDFRLQP
jgi:TonB family protein